MKRFITLIIALMLISSVSVTAFAAGVPSPDIKRMIDYLVLVNKENQLPENWEEILILVTVPDFEGGHDHRVEYEAYDMFVLLREDLLSEGIQIELDSCYRSVAEQQDIWDRFTEEYGIDYVRQYVAVTGFSEHQTGLAIDICIVKDGVTIDDNDLMIAEAEIFARIHAKIADYGFILRYPQGKEDITGYSYEPWHLRYVGSPEVAHEIMDNGLTLEEYLQLGPDDEL
jgi:D-alanyl-D-alanine carboxypeptidase